MSQGEEFRLLIRNLHEAKEKGNKNDEIEVLLKLAQYYYNNSDFVKARFSLKDILKLNSKQPNVNYYLALIFINDYEYEEAIKLLDLELKINPNNFKARELKSKLEISSNFPLVTIFLFLINIIVFTLTYPLGLIDSIRFGVSDFFLNFVNGFTSIFIHINILHLVFNMVILVMFGLILEKHIGSVKFLFIYVLSGVLGNMTQVFFSSDSIVLGASGAIFGILGALMMREPLFEVRVLGFLRVPLIFVLGSFFFLSLLVSVFLDGFFVSGDISHFAGLLVGIFLAGIIYRETIDVFYNWVFICFGFWLVQLAVKSFIEVGILGFETILVNVCFILIGCFLVVYSYLKLRRFVEIELHE